MEIFNQHIVIAYDYLNRFIEEMARSQSSPLSGFSNEHDVGRLKSYVVALKDLKAWIIKAPILDLPKTHPRKFTLEEQFVPPEMDSEVINNVIRMFEAQVTELVGSQSARMSSGLHPDDARRYDLIVEHLESFIEFAENRTPLDLPESSPNEAMTEPGRTGV